MIILVTGCSGFIGSHLCEKLIENDNIVIGIDINDLPYDFKYTKQINFIKEDIKNKINSIKKWKPEIVIHLAALPGVYPSTIKPFETIDTNIKGTLNLLEECKKNGVKKIIYASSSTVYGNEHNSDDKQTSDNLLSPYAISKKTCEMFFSYYSNNYDMKCIGLRFFSVFGPRGRKDMAPYIFINSILNENEVTIYGDGTIRRDFTSIDDIVDGIILAINYTNKIKVNHDIFNLGNNNGITINEFISIIEKCTNKKAKIINKEQRICDNDKTHADLTKSNTILGYKPKISIINEISRTVTYYQKKIISKSLKCDINDRYNSKYFGLYKYQIA
jgi:UDP-glucuronate 4-epimerase